MAAPKLAFCAQQPLLTCRGSAADESGLSGPSTHQGAAAHVGRSSSGLDRRWQMTDGEPARRAGASGTPGAGLAVAAEQPAGRLAGTGREAAGELFTACYPRLAGWVRRLVDTDEDAHDIAAEAFARLLGRWSGVDNPRGYLYMIAANLVSDHWRKTGREQRAIQHLAAAASCARAPEADVRALIEALPPRLRAAFLLHHYAGFEVRQIAAMTGRPEGTIKADLHHARARLKAALTGTGGDSAPGR
jgi:RNA polymerase sigma-70 factor (ECF subfamily)